MRVDQLTIVGVGLIGGSVGLAAKSAGLAGRVVGVGRDEPTLARAQAAGAIDTYTTAAAEAARDADLVVVCTPVDRIAADVRACAAAAPARCVLTDAGSTKARLVADLAGEPRFVGSHPLAGSERRGAVNGRADLFAGRVVVVTPGPTTDLEAVAVVDRFWQALGAAVVRMDPSEHDRALAFTSHLPHAAAAALAAVTPPEWLSLTAGGFRDSTRIAAGDPALWAAIFRANKDAVLAAVDRFRGRLDEFARLLDSDDGPGLERWLLDGKRVRDALGS
jgi:prephenate dehydrogenase